MGIAKYILNEVHISMGNQRLKSGKLTLFSLGSTVYIFYNLREFIYCLFLSEYEHHGWGYRVCSNQQKILSQGFF